MANYSNSVSSTHDGYVDALNGLDPNPQHSYPGSSYDAAYIIGCEDRQAGVKPSKVEYFQTNSYPVKRGQEITIRKGTMVKAFGKEPKPAGRTYKVTLHDVCGGTVGYFEYSSSFGTQSFRRPEPPKVCWAGAGGLWTFANLEDVLEGV